MPGLGFHFLHGLLLGVIFVLAVPFFSAPLPIWVLGPGYGIVLYVITLIIHKPITGWAPWSGSAGSIALAASLGSHIIYGVTLALLVVWP